MTFLFFFSQPLGLFFSFLEIKYFSSLTYRESNNCLGYKWSENNWSAFWSSKKDWKDSTSLWNGLRRELAKLWRKHTHKNILLVTRFKCSSLSIMVLDLSSKLSNWLPALISSFDVSDARCSMWFASSSARRRRSSPRLNWKKWGEMLDFSVIL